LSRAKKRLTHPRFLQLYRGILRPDGQVHLKTDSPDLYAFTRTVIGLYDLPLYESSDNVYARAEVSPELSIRTHYESLDIAGSNRVHYLRFGLRDTLPDPRRAEALKELLQHAVD
jgi:tRNA (guanine-N7-)-methyltransferase